MTELIQGMDASQLNALIVASEQRHVVLLFWAPWHLRSREMRGELERLAAAHADEIAPVFINTDRYVDLAVQYGLRSVPLVILFLGGDEIARTSGPNGCDGLLSWLWRQGAARSSMPEDFELLRHELGGAFHGDTLLGRSVIERLRERVCSGAVVCRRVPFWCDGVGTISGALADSLRPDIVEARSGLPFSFVCALEFLCLEWSAALVDTVFGEIKAGADLSLVAIRLVRDVFADPSTDWRVLIDDEGIDQLRLEWIRLLDRHVCGLAVAQTEWDAIVVGLGLLRSHGRDPSRAVQDAFIDMLGMLSPPPLHDDDLWVSALSLHGVYLQHVIVQHDLGWSRADFAFEGVRGQWFLAREIKQPGGRFSDEALAQARQQWMLEYGDEQRRYDLLLQESSANFPLLSHRICQRLIVLLRESADMQA
jgi:thioredoxin 1